MYCSTIVIDPSYPRLEEPKPEAFRAVRTFYYEQRELESLQHGNALGDQ
jgi:hypothetical protein